MESISVAGIFLNMRRLIEHNPSGSMLVSGIVGLLCPWGGFIPDQIIIMMVASMVFFSCYKINSPLRDALSWQCFLYCIGRFAILPMLAWKAVQLLAPDYAMGVLFLALCPAGASSAAFTGLYKGNVALALLLTVVSSLLCIVFIPMLMAVLAHQQVAVPVVSLLKTLLLCIAAPGFLYVLLHNNGSIRSYVALHGRLTVVMTVSALVFLVLCKKRDFILQNPSSMFVPLGVATAFYAAMIVLSFLGKTEARRRIAYGVCSIFNNSALGIGLAVLYFDQRTVAVLISTELTWALLPMCVSPIIDKIHANALHSGELVKP